MGLLTGATSLVELILKKYGDDVAGATQELVRLGGFPESVANRIATGELPMDEASRVARREAQTRPETYYNGSKTGGLLEVDPSMSGSERGMSAETGFWGAGSPQRASGYAGNPLSDNSTVYPFRILDNSDYMIVDGQGAPWNNIKGSSPVSVKHWNEGEENYGAIADWTDDYWDTNDIALAAKDKGDFNSVLFRGIADAADEGNVHVELAEMFPELQKMPYGSKERHDFMNNLSPEDRAEAYRRAEAKSNSTGESIAVFDPNDIRSPNAAFDPQYTGSNIMGFADPRLLAGTAAGTAGLLAVPALVKDGVFQHGATSEPVVERKEPVRNQSSLLESVTDFGDEVFKSVRHAAGPLADVFMPYEGVNNYLKTVNDYDKQPTWWDRLGLLDL